MTENPDTAAHTGAYRVLARKYRPSTFDALIGQDAMVRVLSNAIRMGRLAHAFILTGVRGVGKTTTARIIARALNCVGPDGTGGPTISICGVCRHCRDIAEDRHVDVIEMDAASRTGVDDIREIVDGVCYRPISARYKVYIIDEVHMLSKNAFNALLKTLEEPPPHVKFIFATTEIRRVPVTVLSRCQRFDLRRVNSDVLTDHLAAIAGKEHVAIAPAAVHLLARAADGSVRDGLSLLEQAIGHGAEGGQTGEIGEADIRAMLGLADRTQIFDLFDAVMRGDCPRAFAGLEQLYAAGADPAVAIEDLLDVCHWLMRIKIAPEVADARDLPEAERNLGRKLAEGLSVPQLTRAWQMLLKGLGEIAAAPDPLQAAQMVLVRLAYAADLPTPAEALRRLENMAAASPVPAPSASDAPARGKSSDTGRAGPAVSNVSLSSPPSSSAGDTRAPTAQRNAAPQAPSPAGSGGQRAVAGGAPIAVGSAWAVDDPGPLADDAEPPMAPPESFEQAVALFAAKREALLHSNLVGNVHLVGFEPGRIEFRPAAGAPPDLANRLGQLLGQWTGTRWVVSVSQEPGAPTLHEQAVAREAQIRDTAGRDPLVASLLDAFPGARIDAVRVLDRGAARPTPEDEGFEGDFANASDDGDAGE